MVSIGVKTFDVCDFFSFGGYGLALAALVLVVFGAYDNYPVGRIFGISLEAERNPVPHFDSLLTFATGRSIPNDVS